MKLQKRAVLYFWSKTGAQEEFLNQRKVFEDYLNKLKAKACMEIEARCGESIYDNDSIAMGTLRRHAIWRDYEVLLVPTIYIFGTSPIDITKQIQFFEENGVKIYSADEGEISSEKLPQLFRQKFRSIK